MHRLTETLQNGVLTILLVLLALFTTGQNRYSSFFDLDGGASGFLSVIDLGGDTLMAVGSNLRSISGDWFRESHHVVVDANGQLVSESKLSDPTNSFRGSAVISSNSGSIYTSGHYCDLSVENEGYCNFYFAKLDNGGDSIFTKVISRPDTSDYVIDMVQTTPNKILLIGWTDNGTPDAYNANILLITVDTLGNELNRVIYGGSATDFVRSGTLVNTGEVLLTGYTKSFGGNDNDSWVLKADSIGNVQWRRTYNHLSPAGGDGATKLHPLLDGNYIVCGGYDNSDLTAAWGYLMKIDSDGNEIWTRRYENELSQGFWDCEVLDNGTILAAGQTNNTNDGSQAGWLIKTDENGDEIWSRLLNPSNNTDIIRNMLVLDNGDIVMVGFGRGENSPNQDSWILRVDSMGCLLEGCHTVSVEETLFDAAEGTLSIYPNPTSSILTIESQEKLQQVALFDLRGKQVIQFAATDKRTTIDMAHLPPGVYLLQTTNTSGGVSVSKVVKE